MKQYVILVDSFSEIIEFDNKAEAQNLAGIFQSNSDSGYKYHIRKIV
jgi:archaellum biogenesis ATPase FlaH